MGRERLREFIRAIRDDCSGEVLLDEPMSRYTTMRVGGPCDVMLRPGSFRDVAAAVTRCREFGLPLTVLGNGSNVVVTDSGIRGLVLWMRPLRGVRFGPEGTATASGGVMLPALLRILSERGLSGLEFAAGIPGTVGGAVAMNAGVPDASISDLIDSVTFLAADGTSRTVEKSGVAFGYRESRFQGKNEIVLAATMRLEPDTPQRVRSRIDERMERRRALQPLDVPSAGSVFRNPPGTPAARLIEACGLKGMRVGGAEVSPVHANFIVNRGNASAGDVVELIERVRTAVIDRFDVRLEPEVHILGVRSGNRG